MTPVKFQPQRLHGTLTNAWEKLIASRRRLKVLALGKEWLFQFVLGTETRHSHLLSQGLAAGIRLGDYSGAVRCVLLPGGAWLSDLLRGPGIETIQEPFRSAVIGVMLQEFLQSLSQCSHFPLQLVPDAPPPESGVPLYWQMLNDRNQAEIVGSLIADEGLVAEICSLATHWPLFPWDLPDSFRVSVEVLVDSLTVGSECASLALGDIFLLGEFEKWREGELLLRIKQGLQDGSVIPIKLTRSAVENAIFSRWQWRPENYQGVEDGNSSFASVPGLQVDTVELASKDMSDTQQKNEVPGEYWSASEGEETRWMDAVEVTIEFSLGRHTMSLGELRQLGQGHIFPIHPPANGLVNISIQGQSIGRGELVQVGEAVGVLVRELGEIRPPVENES